ncbi:MAG: hypothetical protein FJ100_00465 [Deltaproteobacteria bacterium]|nr:hypothetical protein [Deltaproteobacteria bacterium]
MMLENGRVVLSGAPLPCSGPQVWTPARCDGLQALAKSYPVPIDPQSAALWLQTELQATRLVAHPAVVRPLGLWSGPDGALHLVFERPSGRRWDEIVRIGQQRHGYLAARGWDLVTQTVIRTVGDAIQAAHLAGVAHATLTAESVWVDLSPDGRLTVKVTDFARSAPVVGGPRARWMAAEQLGGGLVDARTDVFRLALLAYFTLTGITPWNDEDPAAARIARGIPPPQIRDDRAQAAWGLVARWPTVAEPLRRALDSDPRSRPAHIAELLSLLGLGQALPQPRGRSAMDLGFAVAAAAGLVLAAAVSLPAEDSKLTRAMLDRQPLTACSRQLPNVARQICERYGKSHANCQQALGFLVAREECPNRVKQLLTCLETP